jgi:hypothetical protein
MKNDLNVFEREMKLVFVEEARADEVYVSLNLVQVFHVTGHKVIDHAYACACAGERPGDM